MDQIKVAVCQHSLSGDIEQNLSITLKQIRKANRLGADIALFPECNLTGYAGLEFKEYKKEDYSLLQEALKDIKALCKALSIWVVAGGYWFDGKMELPYNSLFVINPDGGLELRYDKRLLTSGDSGWDIDWFAPGRDTRTFDIKGIKCGLLICHEWRYPELYREYKGLGVQLIFQSWYDANVGKEEYLKNGKEHGSLIMGAVRSNTANNYLWLAGSNASNPESSIGSFIVRPDGQLVKKLPRNKNGVLVETIDLKEKHIDPSAHNRIRFLP